MMTRLKHLIGWDEVFLVAGLGLVVWGLWPVWERLALIVPGAVLVWIALPQRAAFMARPPEAGRKKDR